MPIVVAAVAVVGGLCLLNLLLTFGVIRRLREQTEVLSAVASLSPPVTELTEGESPAAFSAVTADGELLSGAIGLQVIGFFSSSCSICPERVAPFAEYLVGHQIAKDRALAVVLGPPDEPPPYLTRLADVARLCQEQEDGELSKAFKVIGYPAFLLLDDAGAVLASGFDPASLPDPGGGTR